MHDHNRWIMRPTFGAGKRKCWRRPDIKERRGLLNGGKHLRHSLDLRDQKCVVLY